MNLSHIHLTQVISIIQLWDFINLGALLYVFIFLFSTVIRTKRAIQNHGYQENPDRVHEEVQRSKMGDVFQMLRGLREVPANSAGDGAFPQTLVLGGLGQRLWVQWLVHPEADEEQSRPSIPPSSTANSHGDEREVGGTEDQSWTKTIIRGDWGRSWRRSNHWCCASCG